MHPSEPPLSSSMPGWLWGGLGQEKALDAGRRARAFPGVVEPAGEPAQARAALGLGGWERMPVGRVPVGFPVLPSSRPISATRTTR